MIQQSLIKIDQCLFHYPVKNEHKINSFQEFEQNSVSFFYSFITNKSPPKELCSSIEQKGLKKRNLKLLAKTIKQD